MLTGIKRVAKAGFIGFWRNAYVTSSSVFVITVALFVIGSTMFIDQLLTVSLKNLQAKVDMNVYFVPSAPQAEIDAIRNAVAALPDVASVTLTSREEALSKYRQKYQNNEVSMQALAELDDNPMGADLAIQANQTSQYESIARFLEEKIEQTSPQTVIADVNYNENRPAIDTLTKIIEAVEQTSLIVMLVLILAAIMITFNTIRLAIYTAREEISIMRLVGASNMFIRGPFMLQGAMYGILAGLITLLIFYPAMVWLGPHTETFFEFNIFSYFVSNFAYIFGVLLGSGIVLGLISSILAVARYLRT